MKQSKLKMEQISERKSDTKSHAEQETSVGSSDQRGAKETPENFGKFQLIRLLGEGGMGTVYLAHDRDLNRDVALKLPKLSGRKSAESISRFRREARTVAMLRHPNICPVYKYDDLDGQFYLAMAYVDGKPLSHYVKRPKPVDSRQIALLVRKLALAIAYAHDKGVIHRDLKPANVMIDTQGQPIIMDFGLARTESPDESLMTQTGIFLGTPAYTSPEQITNRKGEVDHRTDIYAIGVMMYEMLAGCLPFQSDSAMGTIGLVLTETPEPPTVHRPSACPRLSEIAMRAMQRSPDERYQTAAELAADLTSYLKGDTRPQDNRITVVPNITSLNSLPEPAKTQMIDAEAIEFLQQGLQSAADADGHRKPSIADAVAERKSRHRSKNKRYRLAIPFAAIGMVLLAAFLLAGYFDAREITASTEANDSRTDQPVSVATELSDDQRWGGWDGEDGDRD